MQNFKQPALNSAWRSALATAWICWTVSSPIGLSLQAQTTAKTIPPRPVVLTGEKSLFDGESMEGWKVTDFAGHGDVRVEKGRMFIEMGAMLSGVQWTNPLPKLDYEVSLDAMKLEGNDFFCGLTFPVANSFCTLIVGGWGGGLVGLSSIDGFDASENDTTRYMNFEKNRWYKIRLRVTKMKIQAWIDNELLVDKVIAGKKIDLRPGEIELSKPFGIATYMTTAALREVKIAPFERPKKIAFIAGAKSHGPGEHEYEKGVRLLERTLHTAPNVKGIQTQVFLDGWPRESSLLDDADAIVLYSDGSDREETAHPLLRGSRLETFEELMKRGAGFVALHYTLFVPTQKAGAAFLDWLGGYFDYETGSSSNKWYSKIETREFPLRAASANHPITAGIGSFTLREELYFHLRFRENDSRWTPVLTFGPVGDRSTVVAWALERQDGGRGFGYSGGHFHRNWDNEQVRRMVLNAILWTAQATVPDGGIKWETENAREPAR